MSTARPEVDVIIPAYNSGRFIRETIASALAQEGAPRHVFVIDDGSTDDTVEIARSFGPGVTVISQKNRGCSAARNTGIAASSAPYIALLDADDIWRPGKLARQIAILKRHPSVGLVFTDMTIVEDGRGVLEDGFLAVTPRYAGLSRQPLGDGAFLLPEPFAQVNMRENFIPPSTVMLRRETILEVGGFDPDFRLCEDAECWLRILRSWRVAVIEDRLTLSRYWGGNLSRQTEKMIRGRLQLGEKVFAHPALYPAGAAQYFMREKPTAFYRLGKVALHQGDARTARRHFSESFRGRPGFASAALWLTTLCGAGGRNLLLKLKRAVGLRLAVRTE